MYLAEPYSLNSSISKQDIGMNAVLNFEFPSVDKGEAGAADLSAGGKRARDVAVMASARRPVEDFGPFIFATVSLSCSTEAMVDTSSAYPKFSSPQADGQQALSFAGRSPFQDNPDALLPPSPDAVDLPCRQQRYRRKPLQLLWWPSYGGSTEWDPH